MARKVIMNDIEKSKKTLAIENENHLLAIVACEQKIHRFAQLNDAGDYEALVGLFTEDGVFRRPSKPDHALKGRLQILEAFKSRPKRKSRHICTNILVDFLSDREVLVSSEVLLFVGETFNALPVKAVSPLWVGGFHDRMVLTDSGWLFSERVGYLELEVGLL